MASRSDASQNFPISPFCDLEIVFCDINFFDFKGGLEVGRGCGMLRGLP